MCFLLKSIWMLWKSPTCRYIGLIIGTGTGKNGRLLRSTRVMGLRPTSDIVFLLIRRETVRWKQSSWMRRWLLHILSGWSTVTVTVDSRPWKCIEEMIRSGGLEAAPSRCVRLLGWSALRYRPLRLPRKVLSGHLFSMISR